MVFFSVSATAVTEVGIQSRTESGMLFNGRVQLVDASSEPDVALEAAGDGTEVIETSLSLERDLERSLLPNLSQLEEGLDLYNSQESDGQQLDTGEVGRLDILAVARSGDLVVIELKAGKAEDRVCGQILRYMGWVAANLAGSRTVRGIVVANDFSESLKFAARAMPNVALIRYDVRFDFTKVSGAV
jgi:RecB family endonuclease NucS